MSVRVNRLYTIPQGAAEHRFMALLAEELELRGTHLLIPHHSNKNSGHTPGKRDPSKDKTMDGSMG